MIITIANTNADADANTSDAEVDNSNGDALPLAVTPGVTRQRVPTSLRWTFLLDPGILRPIYGLTVVGLKLWCPNTQLMQILPFI